MWKRAVCFSCLLLAYSSAYAQFSSDFESLIGSPAGVLLTGQDGYYIPAGTNSIDQLCFTYAGNALGIPANPCGGEQFVGGVGPGGGVFARAQKDIAWSFGTSNAIIGYDFLVTFSGTEPAQQNIGSFSIQPFPGSQTMIALARWTDMTSPLTWAADYVRFNAAGAQITDIIPVSGFSGLAIDTWFRWETSVNFAGNRIKAIRVTNIGTGEEAFWEPPDWYLEGGTGGSTPPTGYRFFTGGGTVGNTIGWDNLNIELERGDPPCDECDPCDMNCDGEVNAFDIEPFLCLLFGGCMPCDTCTGDVDGNGVIDAFDIEPFLNCLFP